MLDFLNFENSKESIGIVKASVHKSGKLGFSTGAEKFMNLRQGLKFNVGFNDNDPTDTCIYLVSANQSDDKAFKLNKAGSYFYLRLRNVFDKRKVNYKQGGIIYDIEELENSGIKYFKLKRRK